MAGINFIGSYSGIDGTQIDKLMEAERMPLVQMSNKKTQIDSQRGAWKDINTRLKSLFDKLKSLQSPSLYETKKATSSDDKLFTANVNSSAVEGTYNIKVDQVATNSRYITDKIDNENLQNLIGEGKTFIIKNADENGENVKNTFDIKVEKDDTLKDIARKINEKSIKHKDESGKEVKGSGIKATIVDGRLVLEDSKTGEREISILDKEGSEGFSELFKSTNPKYGLQKGQQAKFSVNGIDVVKDSNTINDVIEGVVLNIKQKTDKTETITVGQDFEKIEKAVKDFVDQYNSTMNFINSKLDAGDPEVVGSKGDLAGDGSLMRLQKSLRSLVTAKMGSQTTIKDISELGVSTKDRHGDLVFDSSKLKAFMKDDPSAVKEFFTNKSEDNKSTGYIERLNSTIDQFISTKNGIIKTKNESFDRTLKDLNRQIETFNERMERKEKQYIKMFSALDVAMMKGESQMSWLEGQINAMNGQRK